MKSPAFQDTAQVSSGRCLFFGMNKVNECPPNEEISLSLKMILKDRVEVEEMQVRRKERPI